MSFSLVFFGTPNGFRFVKKDFPQDGCLPELDNILTKIDSFGLNKQGMVDHQDRRWVVFKESVADNVSYRGICLVQPAKEANASRAGGYIGVGFIVRNAGFMVGDDLLKYLDKLRDVFVKKMLDEDGFHHGFDYTGFDNSILRDENNIKTIESTFSRVMNSDLKSIYAIDGFERVLIRPITLSICEGRERLNELLHYLDARDSNLGSYALVIQETSSLDDLEKMKSSFDSEIEKTINQSATRQLQRYVEQQQREREWRRSLEENERDFEYLQEQLAKNSKDKQGLEQKIQKIQNIQKEIEKRLKALEQEGKKINPDYSAPPFREQSSPMYPRQQQASVMPVRDSLSYQDLPSSREVFNKAAPSHKMKPHAANKGFSNSKSSKNKNQPDLIVWVCGVGICVVFVVAVIVYFFWPKTFKEQGQQSAGAQSASGEVVSRAENRSYASVSSGLCCITPS